jgi:hypothetical protein
MGRKVRHRKSKDPAVIEQLRHLRGVAGIEREEFFANGGDVKQWRIPKRVEVDKRRRDNKRACRERIPC